jgi:sigma-E factor negative regulatory protein RseB
VGTRIDPELVRPTWPVTPPDWQVKHGASGQTEPGDTGWTVGRLPAGFTKVVEGWRKSKSRRRTMAHLVYSDGLVAVSVFIEPAASAGVHAGLRHQGGLNVYSVRQDDQVITALGETPSATVRQIAMSATRR